MQLNRVDDAVRHEFASIAARIAANHSQPVEDEFVAEQSYSASLTSEPPTAGPIATEAPLQLSDSAGSSSSSTRLSDQSSDKLTGAPVKSTRHPDGSLLKLADEVRSSSVKVPSAILPKKSNIYMRR